jgi:hypothetical protein
MSESPMRGHFRYLRFKTFPMTSRTFQCEVFFPLLSSSKHSGVPEDSKPPTFPSVGLHPHTWPQWGCDTFDVLQLSTHELRTFQACLSKALASFCQLPQSHSPQGNEIFYYHFQGMDIPLPNDTTHGSCCNH